MHLEGISQDVWLVHRLGLVGIVLSSVNVVKQLVNVVWVSNVLDDNSRSLSWAQSSQIGQTVVSYENIQVVLSVVNVGDERNDTGDTSWVGLGWTCRRGVHDGHLCVTQEITGTTQSMQHLRALDVGGVGMGVDVNLHWSVHSNDTQSSNDLWRVGDDLGTKTQLLGEFVPVVEESFETSFGQSDRRRGGIVQGTVLEQVQEGILQNLSPHVQVLEVSIGQTFDNGVGNVTNTGLQWVQVLWHSASLDLISKELNQVSSDGPRHGVRWGVWWNRILSSRFDNGNDSFWINWNCVYTTLLVNSHVWVWWSVRWVDWHVNIVQTFEGWSGGVDFNDNLVRNRHHLWGGTDSWTWNNSTTLSNGGGLNDGDIQQIILLLSGVETIGQILRKHGQVLVKELDATIVDTGSNWSTNLVRRSELDHVVCSPSGLLLTSGGTDKQVELQLALQVVVLNVLSNSIRHNLWGTNSGETGPADVLVVLEEFNTLFWGSELLEIRSVTDSLLKELRHCCMNMRRSGQVLNQPSLEQEDWKEERTFQEKRPAMYKSLRLSFLFIFQVCQNHKCIRMRSVSGDNRTTALALLLPRAGLARK